MPLLKNKKAQTFFGNLQILFLSLFVGTLCFNQAFNHAALIGALFFSLFLSDRELFAENLKSVLVLVSVYLVAIISVGWSHDTEEARFVLEKQMTLFFVPLVLGGTFRSSPGKLHALIWVFTFSVFIACSWLLLHFYICYQALRDTVPLQEFMNMQLHHQFSQPLGLHATYLSMYVCFAIASCLFFFFRYRLLLKALIVVLLLVFAVSLALLSSRIVFIPFCFILLFIVPFFITRRSLIIYAVVLISGFLILAWFAMNFTAFKDRFKTDTLRELNIKEGENNRFRFESITASNDATRAERWKCALELIKERPLTGYGTGDEKRMLAEKYVKYNLTNSSVNNFDAHNQYLAFAIKSGILGILTWLLVLVYSYRQAFRNRNYFHICFLFIISFAALAENILESNKGILFFALFNSIFVLTNTDRISAEDKSDIPS